MTGVHEDWKLANASDRAAVITNTRPSFVTVLDAKEAPQEEWGREEYLKMKYSGPFYADWDAEDITLAIAAFQMFLEKLESAHDLELDQVRLFATGGRGFHLEIPMEVLAPKASGRGIVQLPLIYREMAMVSHVETLDMRVYSARRGRMWRVPNVVRGNGAYKVPITPDEAREMTPELYTKLCSAPRYYRGTGAEHPDASWLFDVKGEVMPPAPAQPNVGLQALFASSKARVENVVRRQARARDDRKQLAKFNGVVPLSVKEILNGQHLSADAGFNDIALQLAILANEFSMDEADFVQACEGVIKNHAGDGSRYSTPRRRADALRERLAYVQASNVYRFSLPALRSICAPSVSAPDLFGSLAEESARFAPTLTDEQMKAGALPEDDASEDEIAARKQAAAAVEQGGIQLTNNGIYVKRSDGTSEQLSTLIVINPRLQLDSRNGDMLGIVADVAPTPAPGTAPNWRQHRFDAEVFASRSVLDRELSSLRSSFRGTDVGATDLRTKLVASAERTDSIQYVLTREGLDIVSRPDAIGAEKRTQLAWVTQDKVVLAEDLVEGASSGDVYVFRPKLGQESHQNLDIHDHKPPVIGDKEFQRFFETLVTINEPAVVGALLGWFVSCFHRRLHHHTHNEFPLVWMFGPAGSGKSTTPKIFYHLFTTTPPNSWLALQRGVTNYAWQVMMSQSVTMPVVVDEFKESEFAPQKYGEYMSDLRGAYNSGLMLRGGVRTGAAKSTYQDVHGVERSTPLIILSESFTHESATRERCIPVSVTPAKANHEAWEYVYDPAKLKFMSQMGAALMGRTLRMDISDFDETWRRHKAQAGERLQGQPPRVIANYAVVSQGLEFLQETLVAGSGLDVSGEIATLQDAVWANANHRATVTPIRSEALKTLQDMAYLSNDLDASEPFALREGKEYAFVGDELHLDMYAVGTRYIGAAGSRRMQVFFRNVDTIIAGLSRMPAVTNDNCTHSPLHTYKGARVFSLSLRELAESGVQPFKGQPGTTG